MIRLARKNRIVFLLVPAIVWSAWLMMMATGSNRWSLFADNWFMTLTMCVGSFVAGASSEGGGAVAFPVMTLVFSISPTVARDFSLMIQSVGMSAASVLIICFGVRVEWRAIVFAGLGGAIGIILGMNVISPLLPPAYVKMFFTSLWLSFAVALFWLNRERQRIRNDSILVFGPKESLLFVVIGVVGGVVSGITGSGLDILTFTMLTLLFRVNEKVATPTSVVLMAVNALVGFAWRGGLESNLAPEAWGYWYVCIPVVVVGAPLGAYFIRQRTRLFIANFLYASILVQFVGALVIVPQSVPLILASVSTVFVGLLCFGCMAVLGSKRLAESPGHISKSVAAANHLP